MNQTELTTCLKIVKSQYQNDTGTNGGIPVLSSTIVNGNMDNFFPAQPAEATQTGKELYRKFALHFATENNTPVNLGYMYIFLPTLAGDHNYLMRAALNESQTDLFTDGNLNRRLYGCGYLNANANPNDTTITVAVEDGTKTIFQAGDKIKIQQVGFDNPALVKGAFKYDGYSFSLSEVNTVASVSVAGDVVTLTLDNPINNTWDATQTSQTFGATSVITQFVSVSSLMPMTDEVDESGQPAPIQATVGEFSTDTIDGVIDDSLISVDDARGVVFDIWTGTFVDQTTFTINGQRTGEIAGGGSINSDTAPINSATGTPYFTLPAAATTGTFVAGESFTFTTYPHVSNFWIYRSIPVGANTVESSFNILGMDVYSQ